MYLITWITTHLPTPEGWMADIIIIFHDFPLPLLFSMTFQAWKMVFLNSMTFHDRGHPDIIIFICSALHIATPQFIFNHTASIISMLIDFLNSRELPVFEGVRRHFSFFPKSVHSVWINGVLASVRWCKRQWHPFPFRSHTGCRIGEA